MVGARTRSAQGRGPVRSDEDVGHPGGRDDHDAGGDAEADQAGEHRERGRVGAVGVVEGDEDRRLGGELGEALPHPGPWRRGEARRRRPEDLEPRRHRSAALVPATLEDARAPQVGGVPGRGQQRRLPDAGLALHHHDATVDTVGVEGTPDHGQGFVAAHDERPRPGRRARRPRPVAQHHPIRRAQLVARLDAELLPEIPPRREVGLRGLAGTPGRVQRGDEQCLQRLELGMLPGGRPHRVGGLDRPPQTEQRPDPRLDHELVPRDGVLAFHGQSRGLDAGPGRPAPEAERLVGRGQHDAGVARAGQRPVRCSVEAQDVDLPRADPQRVGAGRSDQSVPRDLQPVAQPRHPRVQCGVRVLRTRPVRPQLRAEHVPRDRTPCGEGQQGQQHLHRRAVQSPFAARSSDRDAPEKPDVDALHHRFSPRWAISPIAPSLGLTLRCCLPLIHLEWRRVGPRRRTMAGR